MSDIPHEGTARQPLQPWQYIMVVVAVIAAIGVLWFFLHGGQVWHHEAPKPVERSAGSGSVPAFVGPPDIQEGAAKAAAVRPASAAAPPPVDESAEFNAPLMNQQQQTPRIPGLESGARSAQDAAAAALARANASSGGSLFTANAVAYRVPHPIYTIRKGTVIPCTDVTAIDTSSGGNVGVTATLPMDVWSMDHHMILLGKGTTVVGEMGHGLVNGLDRLGVVWREFTTPPPDSVGVSISSPAVGPLGEGGLDGDVNRHEWQKVKGVVALSLLQGGLNIGQALAQSRGTTNIDFSAVTNGGNEIGNTLLRSTIDIPDTIHRDQGLACGIYMAQDIDFSHVYTARVAR
jgi:type IV secretion system protein VirB10